MLILLYHKHFHYSLLLSFLYPLFALLYILVNTFRTIVLNKCQEYQDIYHFLMHYNQLYIQSRHLYYCLLVLKTQIMILNQLSFCYYVILLGFSKVFLLVLDEIFHPYECTLQHLRIYQDYV